MIITRRTALLGAAAVASLPAPVAAQTAPAAPLALTDFALGPADAKVRVIEYASFTCPYCADFHVNVFRQLKTDYIDTGKIRFEYREVYFDRYGLWAALLARCGGEARYFGITDMLYTSQREWSASQDPAVVVENLKKIGRSAGMDDATLTTCMQDGALAEAMVARFETNVKADGIEGTPTLIINGTKYSNMAYADLKVILDAELAK